MLVWAVLAGIAIGASLGALGGGGSILTVPALVYLLHQNAHNATAGSLIIVGVTASAGAVSHWRAGRVRIAAGTMFGLLGVAGSYAGTRFSAAVDQHVLLVAFAALMLVAAAAMLRRRNSVTAAPARVHGPPDPVPTRPGPAPRRTATPTHTAPAGTAAATDRRKAYVRIVLTATVVGLLTGFFGVGGGFVIVPALVLALGFEMPVAIGTSLLVIAIDSAAAFAARFGNGLHLDWTLIGVFTAAAIGGTLAGKRIADRVTGRMLVVAFSALLVVLAGYVLARSVPAL